MMNYIWPGIMLTAILFAALNGRLGEVSAAFFSGGEEAVQLFLTLLGLIALWNGIMKIAQKSGVTKAISKAFSPALKYIFKEDPNSPASQAMSMNIAANILGLGNAALPMGLKAMEEMQKHNIKKDTASNKMIMFVVLNTASVQLIPTTVAFIRARHGSKAPMEIIPAVWVTSVCALLVGLIMAYLLGRRKDIK